MKDIGMKGKILKEIMDLMDQEDGKRLMKHPKLVAAKITVEKPVDKGEVKQELEEPSDEMGKDMEMGEGPEHEQSESEGTESLEDLLGQLPEELKMKIAKFIK